MIPPEEAIALKPAEVEWILKTEKYIDQQLMDKFYGERVTIELRSSPPARRTMDVLLSRYMNRWRVERAAHAPSVLLFSADINLPFPAYPKAPKPEPEPHPSNHPTTWDRIAAETVPDDEVDISIVEDSVPE